MLIAESHLLNFCFDRKKNILSKANNNYAWEKICSIVYMSEYSSCETIETFIATSFQMVFCVCSVLIWLYISFVYLLANFFCHQKNILYSMQFERYQYNFYCEFQSERASEKQRQREREEEIEQYRNKQNIYKNDMTVKLWW